MSVSRSGVMKRWSRLGLLLTGLCGLAVAVAIRVGIERFERPRSVHDLMLSAQSEIRSKLPLKVDDYRTLVDVDVEGTKMIYTYRLAPSFTQASFLSQEPELRQNLRTEICNSPMARIVRDGGVIAYEYHLLLGAYLDRIEISACS